MSYNISIIIPTYNVENTIMNTIKSIKKQSMEFKKIEIIIVDDNSTDKTRTILNKLSKENSNIKCIYLDENSGTPSKPRNEGIKASTTQYIMFLDSDDEYIEDMCETMYLTIKRHNADVVSCNYYEIYGKEYKKHKSYLDYYEEELVLKNINEKKNALNSVSAMVWNKIYNKELIFEKNILFDTHCQLEDLLFNLKFLNNSKKIVFLNKYYGVLYNLNNNSLSHNFTKKSLNQHYNGIIKFHNYLNQNKLHYPSIEGELLSMITKALLLSEIPLDTKIAYLKSLKEFYRRSNLFSRFPYVPLYINILINIFVKLVTYSNYIFKISSKLIKKYPKLINKLQSVE